jgi:hypothetical protein
MEPLKEAAGGAGGAGGAGRLGGSGKLAELAELIAIMKTIPINPPDPILDVHSENPVPMLRKLNNSFAHFNGSKGPTPEDSLLSIIEDGREKARDASPDFEYLLKTIQRIITTLTEDDSTHTRVVVGVTSVFAIEINYLLLYVYNPPNKEKFLASLRELYGMISGYVRPPGAFDKLYRTAKDFVDSSVGPTLRKFIAEEEEKAAAAGGAAGGAAAAAAGGAGAGGGRRKRKYSRTYRKGRTGGSRNKRRDRK